MNATIELKELSFVSAIQMMIHIKNAEENKRVIFIYMASGIVASRYNAHPTEDNQLLLTNSQIK